MSADVECQPKKLLFFLPVVEETAAMAAMAPRTPRPISAPEALAVVTVGLTGVCVGCRTGGVAEGGALGLSSGWRGGVDGGGVDGGALGLSSGWGGGATTCVFSRAAGGVGGADV